MMRDRNFSVEGYPGYVKNPARGTVLNMNTNEISAAKARRKNRIVKRERQENLEKRVDDLSEKMDKITELLEKIVEK